MTRGCASERSTCDQCGLNHRKRDRGRMQCLVAAADDACEGSKSGYGGLGIEARRIQKAAYPREHGRSIWLTHLIKGLPILNMRPQQGAVPVLSRTVAVTQLASFPSSCKMRQGTASLHAQARPKQSVVSRRVASRIGLVVQVGYR